jgi:hypothetical protein
MFPIQFTTHADLALPFPFPSLSLSLSLSLSFSLSCLPLQYEVLLSMISKRT